MERNLDSIKIPEPQLSYLLELLTALGNLADQFILVGGQAFRLLVNHTRPTKDFDFVLNVISLREMDNSIADILNKLGYLVMPEARNFQFQKQIPDSPEIMRIEFLAPQTEARTETDIRVDVQNKIHARACLGAEIVLRESDPKLLEGNLPNGQHVQIMLRLVRPHSLLMMKLVALDDRYKNLRGPEQAEHDRNEARVHARDIIEIVHANIQNQNFPNAFWGQFGSDIDLKTRSQRIISSYFTDLISPGMLLYLEAIRQDRGINEIEKRDQALREMKYLVASLDTLQRPG